MTTAELTPSDRFERSVFALPDSADGRPQRPVRVFQHDPDLLSELRPEVARVALDRGIAGSLVVDEGPWTPPSEAEVGPRALGLLVLEGLLCRTLQVDGLQSPELIGAGDLLRPWADDAFGSLPFTAEWRVLERATVAVLDERFARRVERIPGVTAALLGRTIERTQLLSFQLAIAHVRRAEPRVRMLLWHLADRWGRVTPHGVVVPLRLTHATIARLVCMRRPTVSATLVRLVRAGELARNADGTWLLIGEPPDAATLTGTAAGAA